MLDFVVSNTACQRERLEATCAMPYKMDVGRQRVRDGKVEEDCQAIEAEERRLWASPLASGLRRILKGAHTAFIGHEWLDGILRVPSI